MSQLSINVPTTKVELSELDLTIEKNLFPVGHIFSAEHITKLLRESTPVMEYIGFYFTHSGVGFARSFLPLNVNSSNQHGTHQAMCLAMGADYTGGLALASLIDNEPILGLHELTPKKGMSLWLLSSQMECLMPSTDDVIIEAQIDLAIREDINNRYRQGAAIVFDVSVSFKSVGGYDVAKGVFKYYMKRKNTLAPAKGKSASSMFAYIQKTSAKLVAQFRAEEAKEPHPLFNDTSATLVAGKQGKIIANRFNAIMPELKHMVAARTHHLDLMLQKFADTARQVVFLGVGFDFRVYRLKEILGCTKVFELDLDVMLNERTRLESLYKLQPEDVETPVRIPCNFLTDNLCENLLENGLKPELPTFFIYEGCSMYFTREENKQILNDIAKIIQECPLSMLWMDMVDEKALDKNLASESLQQFLSNIAQMGEPFIYGFDKDFSLLNETGITVVEQAFTTDFKILPQSEIYELYSFNLLKAIEQ